MSGFTSIRAHYNMHPHAVVCLQHGDISQGIGYILQYSKPAMVRYKVNIYAPFMIHNEKMVLSNYYNENQ